MVKNNEAIIFSGFGGQGVMSIGKLVAYSGMLEDKEVSWLPSYGPEMRGGTANCSVLVSTDVIGSPIITNNATSVIAMNLPSLKKFESSLVKDGLLLVNSSLVNEKAQRDDIRSYYIPANELALEKCDNVKVANMIMLGAYLEINQIVNKESVLNAFVKVFGENKRNLLPLNEKALEIGSEFIKKELQNVK
ncbi:2-oxoacid:acceptor oxidoreductase family protein [uncultured Cetobacterium sp.]|uniref:2-oxoacid:acceptor oxidoreductase family protein n=1 Tax=uncultured Cetobacterium sp. TaxID=527638 RepID=UPI0026073CE4|nr:2-oxoacid:acceptor oxidoreductase family protein [uncultured Cetobacterium sp.]